MASSELGRECDVCLELGNITELDHNKCGPARAPRTPLSINLNFAPTPRIHHTPTASASATSASRSVDGDQPPILCPLPYLTKRARAPQAGAHGLHSCRAGAG